MREEVKKNLKILMKNQAIFKYPLSFEEEEEKKSFKVLVTLQFSLQLGDNVSVYSDSILYVVI